MNETVLHRQDENEPLAIQATPVPAAGLALGIG